MATLTDFMLSVATAASAGCIADFATFPLDTAKVRLQIQGSSQALMNLATHEGTLGVRMNIPQYNGLFGTIATIARLEGPKALYNGLSAGLQRQMCFSSVRLGFYEPTKAFYQDLLDHGDNKSGQLSPRNIGTRILAGLTTGGMAVLIAQPTDVVKVRYQASIGGNGHRYASTFDAYRTIARSEGLFGLWRGLLPNVSRNAIINVAEIVCYDVVKDTLLMYRVMKDGIPLHFSAAVIAGFCATLVASPVDVVKTRYMNARPGEYRGAMDCTVRMFAREGFSAFYKGFTPSVCRLVSWNIVMWMMYEQIRGAVVMYRTQKQDGEGI